MGANDDSEAYGPIPPPPQAVDHPKGTEMLRVWTTGEGLYVTVRHGAWEDHRTWGIALADIIQHIADGTQELGGAPAAVVKFDIFDILSRELAEPTDKPRGKFIE